MGREGLNLVLIRQLFKIKINLGDPLQVEFFSCKTNFVCLFSVHTTDVMSLSSLSFIVVHNIIIHVA